MAKMMKGPIICKKWEGDIVPERGGAWDLDQLEKVGDATREGEI